jgi:hypothetical protein
MKWKQQNKPKHAGVLITSVNEPRIVGMKSIRLAVALAVRKKNARYKKRLKKQD